MLVFILAIISFIGFIVSLYIHIMALFGYVIPSLAIISFVLFGLVILFIALGAFLLPSGISTATGWGFRKMGHNYWRLIPKRGVLLIRFAAVCLVVVFIIAVLFSNSGDSFSEFKALSGFPVCLFVFTWISYWYHSPESYREGFHSLFKTNKHAKRHQKHENNRTEDGSL